MGDDDKNKPKRRQMRSFGPKVRVFFFSFFFHAFIILTNVFTFIYALKA